MISQTLDYALRAVVYLADQGDEPRTVQQIAEVTRVPPAYLAKVMQGLSRAGLTHAQRGLHGGFTLLKEPGELTIWDVAEAVEPLRRIRECPLGLASHRARLCPLHKRLDDALALIERTFRETTIAEILAEPTTSKPLCAFPHIGVSTSRIGP
ncbi:MAG: Rrf2 family transcriptional regulator [Gemmataceae bacterium]|nr:Rrf2 family transcriptional regulator [Gemmataceae bacterium]